MAMNNQETTPEKKKASNWMVTSITVGVFALLGIIVGGYFLSHPY